MASWNDFFGTYNWNPEWVTEGSVSVASQFIRYPARPYYPERQYYNYGYNSALEPRVITMELKVPICCEGCEERVLARLIDIEGVKSVKCDQLKQKVTVSGTVPPAEVLYACKKVFKSSKWWST